MNLIQQQLQSQNNFVRVMEFTREEISRLKSSLKFRGDSPSEVITKDVITNSISKDSLKAGQVSDFQKFLMSGPVMTDEEYNYVQEKRKHFNEWK